MNALCNEKRREHELTASRNYFQLVSLDSCAGYRLGGLGEREMPDETRTKPVFKVEIAIKFEIEFLSIPNDFIILVRFTDIPPT